MGGGDVEIKIKRFDPRKMKPHSVCLFLGKRNTGKSFLIKDILSYFRRLYPAGNVISGTDHLNHFYEKFIPFMLIYRAYQASILDKLFKRQEKALREGWKAPGAFLIMDDCLSDKSWQHDPLLRRVFFEGRHSHLFLGLALQGSLNMLPELRMQVDYVFILRNNILVERRKLHNNYCGMMDWDTFESVMSACTENYGCIVIDNTTQSNKLEDQVFYYRAEPHDGLKLCHENFWTENATKYHDKTSSDGGSKSHNGTETSEESTKKGRRIVVTKK